MAELAVILLICWLGLALMPVALMVLGVVVSIAIQLLRIPANIIERYSAWVENREPEDF